MNWLNKRRWYYGISGFLLAASILGIAFGGLKMGVEFTGGSALVVHATDVSVQQMKEAAEQASSENVSVNEIRETTPNTYELRLNPLTNAQKDEFVQKLQPSGVKAIEQSFQAVGPSVGKEMLFKTGAAVIIAVGVILLYVWRQFQDWRFGLAAVIAMLHDSLILVGSYALASHLLHLEVDLLFVTAVLTILSFSVHDTIVVFDQVRELKLQRLRVSLEHIADQAITQTLPRSLNNSLTILIMLASLIALGGESLRGFTLALFLGTLIGTYSSTFVALPLLVDFSRQKNS